MSSIVVICDPSRSRSWEHAILARLREAGHDVSVTYGQAGEPAEFWLDLVLGIEKRRFGQTLASLVAPPSPDAAVQADLVLDLTGSAPLGEVSVLSLEFSGRKSFGAGLVQMLASGQLPELVAFLDGVAIAGARPMIGDRLWLSRAGEDVLAGAMSLIERAVALFEAGASEAIAVDEQPPRHGHFLLHYLPHLVSSLGERVLRKLTSGGRPFYWQVAYRRIEGPGVAQTGRLDGAPFTVLPDDGARFYADPFLIEREGRHFLFVEEFPYATGKGIISVAELGEDGRFGVPRPVLEEGYHLSYPQVFAQDGETFMLPESGGAKRLVLYRAEQFPDRWVVDTVLMADRDINDATLLEHAGRFWLFGTERKGVGSASDTLVVFSAPALRGPWMPHGLNPIAVHRAAARPGGAFIRQGHDIVLPVQDGTHAYGGGLGLMALQRLDAQNVVFAPPRPVAVGPAWARKGIHTLNRSGPIEVVDSAG